MDAKRYAKLKMGTFVAVHFRWRGQWIAFIAAIGVDPRHWGQDEIAVQQQLVNRIFPVLKAPAGTVPCEGEQRLGPGAARRGADR